MRGEEEEQPASNRAYGKVLADKHSGAFRGREQLTEEDYGDGDEDHEDVVVAQEREDSCLQEN